MSIFHDLAAAVDRGWRAVAERRHASEREARLDSAGASWVLVDHDDVDVIAVALNGDGIALDFVSWTTDLVYETEDGGVVTRDRVANGDAGLRTCNFPRCDDTATVMYLAALADADVGPVAVAFGSHRHDGRRMVRITSDRLGARTFTWTPSIHEQGPALTP